MPSYIVPQPDGRWAYYNGVSEAFITVANNSAREAIDSVAKVFRDGPDPHVNAVGKDRLDAWRWGLQEMAHQYGIHDVNEIIDAALPPEMRGIWKDWIQNNQWTE